MPPKKEKKETVKGDEAADLVMDYLRKQNRPYSAIDVSANLHNAVTKAAAAKLLKELHEKGEIEGRASGKQIVYHVHQDPGDVASVEDIAAMDTEIETLKESVTTLKTEYKSLMTIYQHLKSLPTSNELSSTHIELKNEVDKLAIRLSTLQQGNVRPVSADEKARMQKSLKDVEKIYKDRRKMFKEYWVSVRDQLGDMDVQEFWESAGLEDTAEVEKHIATFTAKA